MRKKILFILGKPPYSGTYAQESLDVIMTLAAFDQEVSVLLLDDAVFQLKSGQQPESAGCKNIALMYQALPLYDINTIYVETESLKQCGLNLANLSSEAIEIASNEVSYFCKQFDVILND